ncbi:MAG TPA: HlyD family efflux transporter periplasmic adaptor subunit [Nannocystaceae bacterium]|nr:HlyD family efflux transporter periplasmic adaptor subunit [Nannocystaceae bacterium]
MSTPQCYVAREHTEVATLPVAAPARAHAMVAGEGLCTLVGGVRRLAMQREITGMAAVAAETAAELAQAIRARWYYFQAEESLLWSDAGGEYPATLGLAGFAARFQRTRVAQHARLDPSYCAAVDDPDGTGTERVLAQPIVATNGETHAVVVVARSGSLPPFSSADVAALSMWAEQVAPLFHMLHLESLAEDAQASAEVAGRPTIYREEALAHLAAGEQDFGKLLGRLPWWLRQSHFLFVVVIVAAALFFTVVPVKEYASGPAFIASTGVRDVAAPRGGVVETLLVAPGDVVAQDQLVATFGAQSERAELTRARAELERVLLARLRAPADPTLATAVAQAQADEERAAAQLEAASIRAPAAGRIGDVRIEIGRAVEAGQIVMTLTGREGQPTIVRALVPGRHRPAVELGQPFTLDLDGFSSATQKLSVTAVSDEVVGVAEMRRVVGPQLADALAIQGPVVVVEARLHGPTIESDGRSWTIREGMVGRADIAVRTKPIVYLLFPGLERLLNDV